MKQQSPPIESKIIARSLFTALENGPTIRPLFCSSTHAPGHSHHHSMHHHCMCTMH